MKDLLLEIWKQFKPPRSFSWQTFILLSLFSWFLSLIVTSNILQELLARMGWFFLTVGVGWAIAGTQVNFLGWVISPAPWITGALACAFLFQGWVDDPAAAGFISWPVVSAIIASLPKFLPGFVPTLPDPASRQSLITLFLFSAVMSAWFQFYFLLEEWMVEYPSLAADNFTRSAFVIRLEEHAANLPRGVTLLNQAEFILQQQLEGRSWPETERWLIDTEKQVVDLQRQVLAQVTPSPEDDLWRLQAPPPEQPEYTLRLREVWEGPSSRPNGYYLEKVCLISQAASPAVPTDPAAQVTPPVPSTRVECQPVGDKIWLEPELTGGQG